MKKINNTKPLLRTLVTAIIIFIICTLIKTTGMSEFIFYILIMFSSLSFLIALICVIMLIITTSEHGV